MCCTRNGNTAGDCRCRPKKSSKSYQTKFKIQSISKCDSIFLLSFAFTDCCVLKTWNSIFFIIIFHHNVRNTKLKLRTDFWRLKTVFVCFWLLIQARDIFGCFLLIVSRTNLHASSCELSGCTPMQTSSGRYRIREVYHLQTRKEERIWRRKLVNQSTSSGQEFPLKPIKHEGTQRKRLIVHLISIHQAVGS